MPVTAKLSRKFYETFGDDIANELVDWFNAVDTTYRADLKELIEPNFARFEARMEQRFAEAETRIIRWMVGFLAPMVLGIIGLAISVLLRR